MRNKLLKVTMLGTTLLQSASSRIPTVFAASTNSDVSKYQYTDPSQLQSILHYASWLTELLRLGVSAAIAIIFIFGAWKKASDISANGAATGKRIMANSIICMIWAQCGAIFVGFIIHKLESMIS